MLAAAIALGTVAFVIPRPANAFWIFSALAPSAEANTSTSVVPDGSLPLLAAAVNSDPNPDKGGNTVALTTGSALIADQGPEGTPDINVTPKSTIISSYVVKNGDTLSEIAQSFGVTQNTILWANDLKSATDIHPGDVLTILPVSGIQHTVVKGETLASLAKKYSGDANDIASYNGLDSSASLAVGSVVLIPNGELEATAASTPAKTSSGTKHHSSSSSHSSSVPGDTTNNPYRGGSGAEIDNYYVNPVPGALLTQGLHGENAVDLGIAKGTPIHAAAAGTIIVSKDNGGYNGGYGNYVVIGHPNGTQTLYAHMTSTATSVGETVAQGAIIGYVGMTGDATGPHLHFEVRGARNPFVTSINEGLCHLYKVCVPQ